jgi:hypothetical protein
MGEVIQFRPKGSAKQNQLSLSTNTIYDLRLLMADWYRTDDAYIEVVCYDYNKIRLSITPLNFNWDKAVYQPIGWFKWHLGRLKWRMVNMPLLGDTYCIMSLKHFSTALSEMIRKDTGIIVSFRYIRQTGLKHESL